MALAACAVAALHAVPLEAQSAGARAQAETPDARGKVTPGELAPDEATEAARVPDGVDSPQADPSARAPQGGQVSYEDARVAMALAKTGYRPARDPEGRPVRFVRAIRREVFEEGELLFDWLVWFNHLHVLTQESVVQREVRLRPGQVYEDRYARETERNLRSLGIFALVRVVAVELEGDEGVGVVVFTRDLWSLRLETDFAASNNTLQVLAQLVERNLFGGNQQAALRFERRWDSFSIGQFFLDYRAFRGNLRVFESADLIFNGSSGSLEGGFASLDVERPFYNLDQHWAFRASLDAVQRIHRDGQGGRVALVNLAAPDAACTLADLACARSVYRDQTLAAEVRGTYRRGRAYRQAFSVGLSASARSVEPVAETRLSPDVADAFTDQVLPRGRTQVGPFLRYDLFVPDYVQFEGLGSFGRVEAVRRGPTLGAQVFLPMSALGSGANALVSSADMGWVFAGDDALVSLFVGARARLERGRVFDQLLRLRIRGATPRWLLGRLVWQGSLTGRRRDTAQTFVSLGSLTGLRGYLDGAVSGRGVGVLLSNLEYRTRPVVIESIHLGLVAFYDAGGLFQQLGEVSLSHGVGVGVRLLVPQLNRLPFRFDLGVPLDGGGFSIRLSLGGQQQIALTPAEDAAAAADLRAL